MEKTFKITEIIREVKIFTLKFYDKFSRASYRMKLACYPFYTFLASSWAQTTEGHFRRIWFLLDIINWQKFLTEKAFTISSASANARNAQLIYVIFVLKLGCVRAVNHLWLDAFLRYIDNGFFDSIAVRGKYVGTDVSKRLP